MTVIFCEGHQNILSMLSKGMESSPLLINLIFMTVLPKWIFLSERV